MAHELSGLYENLRRRWTIAPRSSPTPTTCSERQRVQPESARTSFCVTDNEYKSSFAMMSHDAHAAHVHPCVCRSLNREGDSAYEKEAEALSEIEQTAACSP